MLLQRCQPFFGLLAGRIPSAVYLCIGSYERSKKPRQYCTLVISAVTARGVTGVAAAILRIAWGEAAEPVRREQMFPHNRHDPRCSFRTQHRIWQADGENLIRPNAWVRRTTI